MGGGVAAGSAISPVPPRFAVPGMATRISLWEAPNLKSLPSKLLEYAVSTKPRGEAQGNLVAAPGPHPPPPPQWRTPREQERVYLHGVSGWRCPTLRQETCRSPRNVPWLNRKCLSWARRLGRNLEGGACG